MDMKMNKMNRSALKEEHVVPDNSKASEQELKKLARYKSTKLSKFKYNVQWQLYKLKLLIYDSIKNQEWEHMKWYTKVLYAPIGAIFNLLMKITIPPTGEETWDRRFASASPVFGFWFAVILFKLYDSPTILSVGFTMSLVLSFVVYCTTYRHRSPIAIVVLFSLL